MPVRSRRVDKNQGARPGVERVSKEGTGEPGFPAIEIDEAMLYAAAETMASFEHLGQMFGCAGMTLSRHPIYRPIIDKARASLKKRLLLAQIQAAESDRNPTMLIWLGKQHLGQKDVQRTEHTGADGKPIQTEKFRRVIAYFPGSGRRRPEPEAASA